MVPQQEVRRKSKDLVRLALFDEHRRVAIKREDISRKGRSTILTTLAHADFLPLQVLKKEGAKAFPVIFNRAQKILRDSFGFELVEVRARGVENDQILQTQQQGVSPSKEAGKEEERGEEEDTKAESEKRLIASGCRQISDPLCVDFLHSVSWEIVHCPLRVASRAHQPDDDTRCIAGSSSQGRDGQHWWSAGG